MKEVRATIDIRSSPDRIIESFLDSSDLNAWWGVEKALIEPRLEGLYALTWAISEHGYGYVTTGILASLDEHSSLRVDRLAYFNPEKGIFGPMRLEVSVQDLDGEMSRLSVVQDGYQDGPDWDWYFQAVSMAWPTVLESLKAYLESNPARG